MSRWFRRYGFADVYDGLVVGAIPLDTEDVRTLDWIGVTRVLNLVADKEYVDGSRPIVTMALSDAGIHEHRVPIADFGSLPEAALEEATTVVNRWLDEGVTVYVHCRAGWQRSAAVAAGIRCAIRERVDVDRPYGWCSPGARAANPLPHQRDDLRRWWSIRESRMTAAELNPPRAGAARRTAPPGDRRFVGGRRGSFVFGEGGHVDGPGTDRDLLDLGQLAPCDERRARRSGERGSTRASYDPTASL